MSESEVVSRSRPSAAATIIASEGGAGHFPENTGYAVRHSLAGDVDGCELDFHLTSDGVFVAHHDYRLKPALTRNAKGEWLSEPGPLIKNSSLAQLQQFDFGSVQPGSKVARTYPQRASVEGEAIATFTDIEQIFKASHNPRRELWFEAKTDPNDLVSSTAAASYAQALIATLSMSWMREHTVLIAFDWQLLELVQGALADVQTGFLTVDPVWFGRNPDGSARMPADHASRWYGNFHPREFGGSVARAVAAAGGTYWSPYFRDISADEVAQAHDLGIRVSTWGADTDAQIQQALTTGVDSLTTAYPERVLKRSL
ncbi:MAG: glycerophosphodiester phosphodiesterase family protein [Proteobacteria bacterium]|nr:glycerophosphodiester phosphodiesterase family protein [Pseudomonadota bacterium]